MRRRKLTLAAALVALCGAAFVEAAEPPKPQPPLGTKPAAFLALSVADVGREVAWYTETLGFTVHSQGEVPERKIKFALLQQGATLLELVQLPDARPRSAVGASDQNLAHLHGFFKAGFVVENLDATYAALRAKGVQLAFELAKPPGGPYRVFGLKDPEGNLLQIFGE